MPPKKLSDEASFRRYKQLVGAHLLPEWDWRHHWRYGLSAKAAAETYAWSIAKENAEADAADAAGAEQRCAEAAAAKEVTLLRERHLLSIIRSYNPDDPSLQETPPADPVEAEADSLFHSPHPSDVVVRLKARDLFDLIRYLRFLEPRLRDHALSTNRTGDKERIAEAWTRYRTVRDLSGLLAWSIPDHPGAIETAVP